MRRYPNLLQKVGQQAQHARGRPPPFSEPAPLPRISSSTAACSRGRWGSGGGREAKEREKEKRFRAIEYPRSHTRGYVGECDQVALAPRPRCSMLEEGETPLTTPWRHPRGRFQANLPQMPPPRGSIAWEMTQETIHLPLSCLQGGRSHLVPPFATRRGPPFTGVLRP
jgi:hypothetical protein